MSATTDSPQVNGDVPHSAFIHHLLGYPLISDSVSTVKSSPYAQRSLEFGDSAYKRLEPYAKPVYPYFSKSYKIVGPYVKKADDLGDKTLTRVDERFPVVKKPTGELYEDAKNLAYFPIRTAQSGKDHIFSTYNAEVKKVGGESIVTYTKALVSTAVIITYETLNQVSGFLNTKKEETKTAADEKANN